MENLYFLGVPILKHIRVAISKNFLTNAGMAYSDRGLDIRSGIGTKLQAPVLTYEITSLTWYIRYLIQYIGYLLNVLYLIYLIY